MNIMKKIILVMGAAFFLFACNSAGDNSNLSSDSLQNNYDNNDSMNNTDTSNMLQDTITNAQDQPNP
jgi:hypothetical protein